MKVDQPKIIYIEIYICLQKCKIDKNQFEFYGEPSSKAKYYT